MAKRKSPFLIVYFLLIAVLIFLLISSSFAYFRAFVDKKGMNTVMIELIFDRLDFDDENIRAAGYADVENGEEIPWGSKKNPYVISKKYHIQNLSVLQSMGFFASRVEKDKNGNPVLDENGNTIPIQSYFLVCETDGTPVTIDCEGMSIVPIGSDENPFTGVIEGAPIAGTTTYSSYEASLSTIANLTVEAKDDQPDIGFFGKLGYSGTYNAETLTVTGGFAANVTNMLFADVTVSSQKSFFGLLADWWNRFIGHLNHAESNAETHHVGIIAGHAEFATISNVSVYYSEGVAAFNLVSDDEGSNTNYYSSTGLIGFLEYVNPTINEEDGSLDGTGGIKDSDIIGDGSSGGGGEESGTLTGYFLARNLFERHEKYLDAYSIEKKDKYNVMEMKDADGSDLFKTVVMSERQKLGDVWQERTYFYFQDTVFTFAMSMSVPEGTEIDNVDPNKSDYIQTVWKIDDERPSISATDSADKLQYMSDPGARKRISYKLQAVTSVANTGYYVLAYYEKNGTEDTVDDILYILDITDINGERGYVHKIPIGELLREEEAGEDNEDEDDELNGIISFYSDSEGRGIFSLNLVGTNPSVYDYAFYHDGSASIKRSAESDYKFGVKATKKDGFTVDYNIPVTTMSTAEASTGSITGTDAFYYDWTFTPHSQEKGRFSVSATYRLGGWAFINNYAYCWSKLAFSNENDKISFDSIATSDETERNNKVNSIGYSDTNYFTVFSVQVNGIDDYGNAITENTDNEELTAKNILPTSKDDGNGNSVLDTLYDFDPSKYVLEYVGKSIDSQSGMELNNYKLAPIRSYKLNDGTGDLLSELNHIAKLYKTHNENYQLTIGNTFIGSILGNWFDLATNTGGVLNTTIGTATDESDLYSIPTGMVAFEINEASVDNPSYINIIVAVNPEQEDTGMIGLWTMNKKSWKQEFKLDNPTYEFYLPVSKTAKSSLDKKYMLKIVERVVETKEDGRSTYYVATDANGNNETSYVYLGGETVFVYYRFSITSTGVYLLGSKSGPFSVAYFSVSGAAGEGQDGMSGSPLGSVDFVYAYNGKIITTDKMYTEEEQLLSAENYEQYYPSYLFVSMIPEEIKIQHEVVKIRRYIKSDDLKGTKRHMSVTGQIYTKARGVSVVFEDMQDDID